MMEEKKSVRFSGEITNDSIRPKSPRTTSASTSNSTTTLDGQPQPPAPSQTVLKSQLTSQPKNKIQNKIQKPIKEEHAEKEDSQKSSGNSNTSQKNGSKNVNSTPIVIPPPIPDPIPIPFPVEGPDSIQDLNEDPELSEDQRSSVEHDQDREWTQKESPAIDFDDEECCCGRSRRFCMALMLTAGLLIIISVLSACLYIAFSDHVTDRPDGSRHSPGSRSASTKFLSTHTPSQSDTNSVDTDKNRTTTMKTLATSAGGPMPLALQSGPGPESTSIGLSTLK